MACRASVFHPMFRRRQNRTHAEDDNASDHAASAGDAVNDVNAGDIGGTGDSVGASNPKPNPLHRFLGSSSSLCSSLCSPACFSLLTGPLPKKYLPSLPYVRPLLCGSIGIFLLIDLILTVTRQTWPMPIPPIPLLPTKPLHLSHLPLLQRLAYTPGSRGGSFAQNYQDTWIVRLAEATSNFTNFNRSNDSNSYNAQPTNSPLFFLDIGAYHGIWCSNSHLLEQSYNWNGVCVEPFPGRNDFRNRSCQLFVNAMSDVDGKVVRFSGVGQERKIGGVIDDGGDVGDKKRGLTAQTISFPTLLRNSHAPPFLAFISLDVEGHEYATLTQFPWDDYKVGAWIIEGHSREVIELLEGHGYVRRPVDNRGADEYFVREEFWREEMRGKEWRVHPLFSWGC